MNTLEFFPARYVELAYHNRPMIVFSRTIQREEFAQPTGCRPAADRAADTLDYVNSLLRTLLTR